MFNKIKSFCGKVAAKAKNSFNAVETAVSVRAHAALDGTKAEAYVDTGVKILIAVVIGALLLALLYTLFNSTIAQINQEKKQRVAAYCRVSTDSEDQSNSFSAQLRYYSEYIKSNAEMEFVDIYADEGITGTCVNKRDEFKRMIKDASNGKLDRIFVKSVSRFARNSLECLESIRTLNSFGVTVLFENDNIDTKTMNSELILYVKSAFAQSEALAGSKRVATAIRMKMENGEFITCNAPYGYRLNKECHLSVIPEEAEIVKRIFKLYLSGNGIGKIVAILNDERVPSASGKWSIPGIRYILTNEKYIGDSLLQKTYTPQMLPLRNIPNKGELDRYYVANSHEGIVSREDFELVQLRMKQVTSDRRASQKHFFTGIIECAECGWSYKRKVQNDIVYWVCSRKTMAGHSCGGKNISEEDLKKAFVVMYNKLRRFEKEVLDKTLSQLLNLREKVSGQNNEISQIDAEIASLCNKNNTYTELHTKGIIDDVSYLERTSELKYKITELRGKRVKLLNADEDERLIEDLKVLKETLDEYPKVILRFDNSLFSAIVDKIVVGSEKTVMFKLKGGLHLEVKMTEVR